MIKHTQKVPVVTVPFDEETVCAATTTSEDFMASEHRTKVMRRLTVRQQMFFVLRELGYTEQEIVKNFNTSMQAIYHIRHKIRVAWKKIKEDEYN